jgi:uncharacterized membrane protein
MNTNGNHGIAGGDAMKMAMIVGGGLLTILGVSRKSALGYGLAAFGGSLMMGGLAASNREVRDMISGPVRVRKAITINKPRQELYDFWRDLGNLPRFMRHLERVEVTGNRSHWVARAPLGAEVSWDAEIVEDVPGERISWRSVEGSEIPNHGSVTFADAPGNRGTEILVELHYDMPASYLGAAVARMFGEEPYFQINEDLRRMKSLLETGVIPSIEGQPHGERGGNPVMTAAVKMMEQLHSENPEAATIGGRAR